MQFEESDETGSGFIEWANLSWKLSKCAISERCKTVLQKGGCLYTYNMRRQLYSDLTLAWEAVIDGVLTPAQAIAECAPLIMWYHKTYHAHVNSDRWINALLNQNGNAWHWSVGCIHHIAPHDVSTFINPRLWSL